MWTEPEHFAAWYGPAGAQVVVAKMDVRVGGARLIGMEMQTPDGLMRMWFTGEYRQVVAHRRLVYTESMSDPDGKARRPIWAYRTALHDDRGHRRAHRSRGRTAMILTHAGIPADSRVPPDGRWR